MRHVESESIELQTVTNSNNNVPDLSAIDTGNGELHTNAQGKEPIFVPNNNQPTEKEATPASPLKDKPKSPEPKDAGIFAKMAITKCGIFIIFGVGIVLLISSIVLGIYWVPIVENILDDELTLTPTSKSYGMWQKTPIPMYCNIYLYNWTNTEEFSNTATTKPNFVQMGPYVFREVHIKVNQSWHDNGTITFRQQRFWYFEESMSNGTLDDKVTNLDVISATVGFAIRNEPRWLRIIVNGVLVQLRKTLFTTKTVRELLFEGYDDQLLDFARKLNMSRFNIPFDKFGWFYDRNGSTTYDGIFNMRTGNPNISDLGVLDLWNYRNKSDHWEGECSEIRGTTGELWSPIGEIDTVEIFAPDICTSLSLTRVNDSFFSGLRGATFVTDSRTFDNGSIVPSRACYCSKSDECQPSGLLDVSQCRFGAPAFIGLPHFYLADDSYANAISGMNPKQEEYNFEMTLEPNTGIPLDVKAQMQINIMVEPISSISILSGIPKTYVPMLWFRQEARLTSNYASQIKFLLALPTLGHYIFIALGVIGFALCLTAAYFGCRSKWSREETQSLIPADTTASTFETNPVTPTEY
ncbi:protein croquemort-like isoform X2 [Athalia rosae]|uniref:protein croquemort-like isoform X2 n=1 Tax=Athalia rosae TaxID=37344 RepID=UPI002033550D|nr:protein croquemort-like isoform X2 [Athalia rosae]